MRNFFRENQTGLLFAFAALAAVVASAYYSSARQAEGLVEAGLSISPSLHRSSIERPEETSEIYYNVPTLEVSTEWYRIDDRPEQALSICNKARTNSSKRLLQKGARAILRATECEKEELPSLPEDPTTYRFRYVAKIHFLE